MDERELVDHLYQKHANDDPEFPALINDAFPALVRAINDAWDEADRADRQRDERECRIAELELEVASLRKELLIAG